MTELSAKNQELLKGSEVYVPMNETSGFVVSIPEGSKVTLSRPDGIFQMVNDDVDGPQPTMKVMSAKDIEKDPQRAAHMQTVKGLDNPGAEITIERNEGGMSAVAGDGARLTQGVTSITEEQVQRVLQQNAPAQKSTFAPG